jgi:predicted esterase
MSTLELDLEKLKWTPGYICDRYIQHTVKESMDLLKEQIMAELKELDGDSKRLFLGGYSRGGSIALSTYLDLPKDIGPLGGVFAVSAVHCHNLNWEKVDIEEKKKTPLKLWLGQMDMIIPGELALTSYHKMHDMKLDHWHFELEDEMNHMMTDLCTK